MATRLSSQSQLFFIRMVIREIKMVVKISNYNYNQNMIDVFNCIWIVKNVFVTKVLYSFVQIICNLNLYCSSVQSFKYRRLFSGTYPLIYSHPWSFYMQIHYMRAYFWSPYLSHITRSTCTYDPKEI